MSEQDQRPDDGSNRTQESDTAPVSAPEGQAGVERYPAVRQDDSVETLAEDRSFEGEGAEPRARKGGETPDPSVNQGHMGPDADPVEGKR